MSLSSILSVVMMAVSSLFFSSSPERYTGCSQLAGDDIQMDLYNSKEVSRSSTVRHTMYLGNLEFMYTQAGGTECQCHTNPCDRGAQADSAPKFTSRRQAWFRSVAPFGRGIILAAFPIFYTL